MDRKKSYLIGIPIFGALLGLFSFYSISNYISHSELWSIASAPLLGQFITEASVVYYKSLFHLILKIPFFFDLDNMTHILLARHIFGVIAAYYVFLWFKIAFIVSKDWFHSSLYLLFLMSFQLFTYNIYRVRADLLAFLFISLLIFHILLSLEQNKIIPKWKVLVLCFIAFLCTPKAIVPILIVLLSLVSFYYKNNQLSKVTKPVLITFTLRIFFVSLLSLCLFIIDSNLENPYGLALIYFSNNISGLLEFGHWHQFISSFKINFLSYFIIFGSLIYALKKGQSHFSIHLSIMAWALFLIYPEKWDYFTACLIPILSLPILKILSLGDKKKIIAAYSIIFIVPLLISGHIFWFTSNTKQQDSIKQLERLVQNNPNITYFDGTGLLPRHKSLQLFIGPRDPIGNEKAIQAIQRKKPELIFYTGKSRNIEQKLKRILLIDYKLIEKGVWVLRSYEESLSIPNDFKLDMPLENLFIYDFKPR